MGRSGEDLVSVISMHSPAQPHTSETHPCLFSSRLGPLQNLIDSLTDILTRVIPGLVQGVVSDSPLLHGP